MDNTLIVRLLAAGTTVELKDRSVLGRGSDADLQLPYAVVSRRHCRLEWRNGNWYLVDLGSLNGTWVNGTQIMTCQLLTGDIFRVGDVCFSVE